MHLIEYLPLAIMSVGACVLTFYYTFYFLRLHGHEDRDTIHQATGISVLICAHNEEENLKKNLPYFLNQKYPLYEVVVISDGSWDDTSYIVKQFQREYANLKLVELDKDLKRTAGKKMALTLGIKAAQYDRFILSDADCHPHTEQWLSNMGAGLQAQFVLGYGKYQKSSGLINLITRYDTFHSACLYFSKAIVGEAYMGVGRNLGYTRQVYDRSGGFKSHYHLAAGDDDLFVNKNARKGEAHIVMSDRSHTITTSETSISAWFRQKRRHLGVSGEYSTRSKFWLAVYHLSQYLFYAGLCTALASGKQYEFIGGIFFAKTLIQLLISNDIARRLREKDLLVLLPILEPISLILNTVVAISVKSSKPRKWK